MNLSDQTKRIQSFIKAHHNVGGLHEKEVSDFYIQLIDCIVDHNHLYYIENKPIISDKEYDKLFDYLKRIEEHFPKLITSNSPTQTLIGQVSEGFKQAKHDTKLLSLENTYNADELKDREERIIKLLGKDAHKPSYLIEPKFDGLSVELIYRKGEFHQAITRGDGRVGDDVTANVKTIKNIPKKLKQPLDIHVRGEIVMPKSAWKKINEERREAGETPFANTRNAASGSIKLLDSGEVAKRGLLCYVYDILESGKVERLKGGKVLGELGFHVFPWKKEAKYIEDVIKLCEDEKTKKMLEDQDIEFDGLVIKVQNEKQRELIGSTDHHPRWAVAYKFPAQLAATQIISVDVQVGRTGILTPVANFEPVQLSGATLKRVSLHNRDFIKEKDIHIHDWIWLQRSGEVIPYIVSVITDRRTGKEKKILPPRTCPSCHEKVKNVDIHYYCTNPQCPQKVKQQILHFVSKNCMDISGIGESMVDILVDNGIVETIADIYTLTESAVQVKLTKFPGIGDKKVAEIVKGIEESKHKPLRRLLNGLGISHVGKKMAQDLALQLDVILRDNEGYNDALHFIQSDTIKKMTDKEFLRSIYGIGEKTVESITKFFHDKHNLKILDQLEKAGVNMNPQKYADHVKASEAKGTFSITGSFDLPREKIAEYFQEHGYLFHEQPTKTTDFILIGEKPGSKKDKAIEFGIQIYEGRDVIMKKFPFLKDISNEGAKPKAQGLF